MVVTFSINEDLDFSPEGLARQAATQTRFKVVNSQQHDDDMHVRECHAICKLTDAYINAAQLEMERIMDEREENVTHGLGMPGAFSLGEQRGSGQHSFLRQLFVSLNKLDFYFIFLD